MTCVPNTFENASATFDGSCRSDVVREARHEQTLDVQRGPRFANHLTQGPRRQSSSAGRGTDAVADVADVIVELVAQSDSSHHEPLVHDPPGRTVSHVRTRSARGMSEPDAVLNPCLEALRRVQIVFLSESESVLVQSRAPVVAALEKGGVESRRGKHQLGHLTTVVMHAASRIAIDGAASSGVT
jgi:hypothetical protein